MIAVQSILQEKSQPVFDKAWKHSLARRTSIVSHAGYIRQSFCGTSSMQPHVGPCATSIPNAVCNTKVSTRSLTGATFLAYPLTAPSLFHESRLGSRQDMEGLTCEEDMHCFTAGYMRRMIRPRHLSVKVTRSAATVSAIATLDWARSTLNQQRIINTMTLSIAAREQPW